MNFDLGLVLAQAFFFFLFFLAAHKTQRSLQTWLCNGLVSSLRRAAKRRGPTAYSTHSSLAVSALKPAQEQAKTYAPGAKAICFSSFIGRPRTLCTLTSPTWQQSSLRNSHLTCSSTVAHGKTRLCGCIYIWPFLAAGHWRASLLFFSARSWSARLKAGTHPVWTLA